MNIEDQRRLVDAALEQLNERRSYNAGEKEKLDMIERAYWKEYEAQQALFYELYGEKGEEQ